MAQADAADACAIFFGASESVWNNKNNWKERIDVENPDPGGRAGQIHSQNSRGGKWMYDVENNKFIDAPKSVNKLLENKSFKKGINKALKYLGEKLKFN